MKFMQETILTQAAIFSLLLRLLSVTSFFPDGKTVCCVITWVSVYCCSIVFWTSSKTFYMVGTSRIRARIRKLGNTLFEIACLLKSHRLEIAARVPRVFTIFPNSHFFLSFQVKCHLPSLPKR